MYAILSQVKWMCEYEGNVQRIEDLSYFARLELSVVTNCRSAQAATHLK